MTPEEYERAKQALITLASTVVLKDEDKVELIKIFAFLEDSGLTPKEVITTMTGKVYEGLLECGWPKMESYN